MTKSITSGRRHGATLVALTTWSCMVLLAWAPAALATTGAPHPSTPLQRNTSVQKSVRTRTAATSTFQLEAAPFASNFCCTHDIRVVARCVPVPRAHGLTLRPSLPSSRRPLQTPMIHMPYQWSTCTMYSILDLYASGLL